jgi:DNA-binding MarR family transcriptional regulator
MPTMKTQKRAFISYSHDDQEFVRRLADALNRNGVPLFFVEWDIRPGDSIIRKIFEEGLAESTFFSVVLSKTSVSSSWVKDELDVETVRRIESLTRVVPILKEDCEIPRSLRALRWLDMREDFEAGVRELTKLAHGVDERTPLGEATGYIGGLTESIGGLTREATSVGIYLLGRVNLDDGTNPQVGGDEIRTATQLTPQEINDAVDELEGNGLVRTVKWLGTSPFDFGVAMPTYVIFLHFKERLPYDPEEDIRIVLHAIAAIEKCAPTDLQKRTGLSAGRLNRAVDYLEDYGLAKVMRHLGTAPFSFGGVIATSQTRRAARDSEMVGSPKQ